MSVPVASSAVDVEDRQMQSEADDYYYWMTSPPFVKEKRAWPEVLTKLRNQ